MITTKQAVMGLAAFIDNELLPAIGAEGAAKYGIGVVSSLLLRRGEAALDGLKDKELVKSLGLVTDQGIDAELLKEVLLERFPAEGIRIEAEQINGLLERFLGKLAAVFQVRLAGAVTFHRADLEKLFSYMMGG